MAPCEECVVLRRRIAELEKSNRDLRHIRKAEDELEALHSAILSPSCLGPTLHWSPSDSVPDVDPVLRVGSIAEEVLKAESFFGPLTDGANIALSTPLAGLPAKAGSGSVSGRRRDLLREAVAVASARVAAPNGYSRPTAAPTPEYDTPPSLPSPSAVPSHLTSPPAPSCLATPSTLSAASSVSPVVKLKRGPTGTGPTVKPKHGPNSHLPLTLPLPPLPTQNRFEALEVDDEFPPLSFSFPPGGAESRSHKKHRSETPVVMALGGAASHPPPASPVSTPSPPPTGASAIGAPAAGAGGAGVAASAAGAGDTMLIIGSSMVRHVKVHGAAIHSIRGGAVNDVHCSLLRQLRDGPHLTTAAIHAGANDLRFRQPERLKDDFRSLIRTIRAIDNPPIQPIISGPFISPRYNYKQFSQMRDLHIWLKGYCCNHSIPYVDNYSLFTGRDDAFDWDGRLGGDGLHLNRVGARLLSRSIALAAQSHAWTRGRVDNAAD